MASEVKALITNAIPWPGEEKLEKYKLYKVIEDDEPAEKLRRSRAIEEASQRINNKRDWNNWADKFISDFEEVFPNKDRYREEIVKYKIDLEFKRNSDDSFPPSGLKFPVELALTLGGSIGSLVFLSSTFHEKVSIVYTSPAYKGNKVSFLHSFFERGLTIGYFDANLEIRQTDFDEPIEFADTTYNQSISILNCKLYKGVKFIENCHLHDRVSFSCSEFWEKSNFSNLTFEKDIDFQNISLDINSDLIFPNTQFNASISFIGTRITGKLLHPLFESILSIFSILKNIRKFRLSFNLSELRLVAERVLLRLDFFTNNYRKPKCLVDFRDTGFKNKPHIDNLYVPLKNPYISIYMLVLISLCLNFLDIFSLNLSLLTKGINTFFIFIILFFIVKNTAYLFIRKEESYDYEEDKFRVLKLIAESNSDHFKSCELNSCELECRSRGTKSRLLEKIPYILFKDISFYGLSLQKPLLLWLVSSLIFSLTQLVIITKDYQIFSIQPEEYLTTKNYKELSVYNIVCPSKRVQNGLVNKDSFREKLEGGKIPSCADKVSYLISPSIPIIFKDTFYEREVRQRIFGENGHIEKSILAARFLQSVCTYIAIFLFALGLRNRFKI